MQLLFSFAFREEACYGFGCCGLLQIFAAAKRAFGAESALQPDVPGCFDYPCRLCCIFCIASPDKKTPR